MHRLKLSVATVACLTLIGVCVFGRSAVAISPDEERSLIENLKERVSAPIPEGEYLLYHEIDKNDNDIATLTQLLANEKNFKDCPSKVDAAMSETKNWTSSIKALICPAHEAKLRDDFSKLYQNLVDSYQIIEKNDWEGAFTQYSDVLI